MRVAVGARRWELNGSRALAATVAGAAFTAICAQIGFHLPGNIVPVTLQVFAVICCGMALGGRLGALAQIEYLAAGAAGAPVFAGFKAGPAALIGPTGGYLVGFVAAAYLAGALLERVERRTFRASFFAGLVGAAAILLLGRAWFGLWTGDLAGWRSWALGVAPFVGCDIVKVAAAAAIWAERGR